MDRGVKMTIEYLTGLITDYRKTGWSSHIYPVNTFERVEICFDYNLIFFSMPSFFSLND